MRGIERNTPNIYLIYQTINIIMKKTPSIICSIPAQTQTITGHHQGDHTQLRDSAGYYPPPPDPATFSTGMHMEEENALFSTDIDFSVKRPD